MGSPFVDASVRAPAPSAKLILLGRRAILLEKIDPDRHPFLTLVRERKVIEVIAPAREVGRRGDA
jgi:hypothetical protein